MTATALGALGMQATWTQTEVFTGDQRVSCELRLVGRLRERLADDMSQLKARNLTTVDAAPQVPRLNAVQNALLDRNSLVACTVIGGEAPDPDAPATVDRFALFEGHGWTVSGVVGLTAGGDAEHQVEQLVRSRFQLVRQPHFRAEWGGRLAEWTLPEAYVNALMATAVYLG
jgi:hypothetical protein